MKFPSMLLHRLVDRVLLEVRHKLPTKVVNVLQPASVLSVSITQKIQL
jgi:hypothetical protein